MSLLLMTAAWMVTGGYRLAPLPVVHAGSCTWTGSVSTDWHTGGNWGSGCSGTGGIPASGDNVVIPAGPANQPIISSADAEVTSLTIQSGASLTVQNGRTLSIAGTFTKSGSFEPGTGTVVFNGSNGSIAIGNTSFYDLRIASGAVVNTTKSFYIRHGFTNEGTFTATANTVRFVTGPTITLSGNGSTTFYNVRIYSGKTVNAGGHSFTVSGDSWTNDGTFNGGTGTVTFNKSGTVTYSGSGTTTFYDLQISSGTTLDVGTSAPFDVTNSLRNQGKLKQTKTIGTGNVAFLNVSSGTYYGLEIDPEGSTSMGSTTVTIYGEQTCPSPPSLGVTPIKRCYDIAPTTQTAATIKFWFDDTYERNGNIANQVKIYHQKGGLWHSEPGTHSYGSTGGFDWVQVTGVDEYSPFTGTSNTPSAPALIELAFFTATAYTGHVLVEWETASEIDNAGFNLWRALAADGPYTRLNPTLIPARGSPTRGARYAYADRDVVPGTVYWYKLEDVDIHDLHTFHGPVASSPLRRYPAYLPLLAQRR